MPLHYAFNGDADGLCALQQLRLNDTSPATLITGVKRDIHLLSRITASEGDQVTVLDVSLDSNRNALIGLLDAGVGVRYFDHHHAGELPTHAHFASYIDTAADVCTSVLVDRYLKGRYRAWAAAAAFGDSLPRVGQALATELGFDQERANLLEQLGIALNYNAYGESIADLHFDPADLAARMLPYADPFDFINASPDFAHLWSGYLEDMTRARALAPERQKPGATIVRLPDEAWARRAIGVLANELMHAQPDAAIGILSPRSGGGYTVSVRVPARSATGADEFCLQFATGGGRKGAGGINHLPESDIDLFGSRFEAAFART